MYKPHCPKCQTPLRPVKSGHINYLACANCSGQSVSLFNLDKILKGDIVINLWQATKKQEFKSNINCPSCITPMNAINYTGKNDPTKSVQVDVCKSCKLIWLDQNEAQDLKSSEQGITKKENQNKDLQKEEGHFSHTKHPGGLKTLITLMGLPIEAIADEHKSPPILTWLFLTLSIIASFMAFHDNALFSFLSFSTLKPFTNQIFNSFSVFFVHGGWMHLLGNMYFLAVFGDNVEVDLGKAKYMLLVILATVVGTFAFAFFDRSGTPLVGASGGISGLLGYYLLRFSKRKFIVSYFFNWFYISGLALGALYLGKDLLGLLVGGSNVAHISHLSGIFVGVMFYFWQKPKVISKEQQDPLIEQL